MSEEKPRLADVMRDVEKLMIQLDATVAQLQQVVSHKAGTQKLEE